MKKRVYFVVGTILIFITILLILSSLFITKDYKTSENNLTEINGIKGKLSTATIEKVIVTEVSNYYQIITDDARELNFTEEHPFYVNGEWVEVKNLKVGDELFTSKGDNVKIISIKKVHVNKPFKVYNLEVGYPHTYFANGILVHNKPMRNFYFTEESISDIKARLENGIYDGYKRFYSNEELRIKEARRILQVNKIKSLTAQEENELIISHYNKNIQTKIKIIESMLIKTRSLEEVRKIIYLLGDAGIYGPVFKIPVDLSYRGVSSSPLEELVVEDLMIQNNIDKIVQAPIGNRLGAKAVVYKNPSTGKLYGLFFSGSDQNDAVHHIDLARYMIEAVERPFLCKKTHGVSIWDSYISSERMINKKNRPFGYDLMGFQLQLLINPKTGKQTITFQLDSLITTLQTDTTYHGLKWPREMDKNFPDEAVQWILDRINPDVEVIFEPNEGGYDTLKKG